MGFLLAGLIQSVAQPAGTAVTDAPELIDQVLREYESGNLAEAERLALRALARPDSLSKYEKFNLHKLLAFIAVANDDEEGAVRQFTLALHNNPNLSPDPVTWSPKVRRAYVKAREKFAVEREAERKQLIYREAELCRQAAAKSLFLPGRGQIFKGESSKGWLVGTAFGVAAVTFIYAQATIPSVRDRYLSADTPDAASRRWRTYRNRVYLANISGLLASGVYGYGLLDALFAPAPTVHQEENGAPPNSQ